MNDLLLFSAVAISFYTERHRSDEHTVKRVQEGQCHFALKISFVKVGGGVFYQYCFSVEMN